MSRLLLFAVLLLSIAITWADSIVVTREYTYSAGDADSKISARQMATQEIKRELLNEMGTHIYSRVDVTENSDGKRIAKQEIRTITAGFVKIDILEEAWNGYEFYIKAKMNADPQEILRRINDLATNDDEKIKLKEQLRQSVKAFEDLRLEMLSLKRAPNNSKSKQERQQLAVAHANVSKSLSIVELFDEGQNFYWGTKGGRIDYIQANKWFKKAATQGHKGAQYNLGIMYGNGQGVQQDYDEAVYWYRKAADQGYAPAQNNLGIMYGDGKGVQQNYTQKIYWLRKAAEQGLVTAQFLLGGAYEVDESIRDYTKSVYWYQKAAEQGDADAQLLLGIMYENGKGTQQDDKQAVHWYLRAADQGHAYAQFNLGIMYFFGSGVQQDSYLAAYWLQKSADKGHKNAEEALMLLKDQAAL